MLKVKARPIRNRGEVYAPRLRILVDPIYVQPANLSGSSTYHKYVSLVRELVSRGHFVYWMVPDAEYDPHEIEENPNVAVIRTKYIQDQFLVDGLITDDFFNLFNRVGGRYHIDVLCTSRNSLLWSYKRSLEPARFHDQAGEQITDKSYGLPVYLIEEFPQTPARQFSSESYWLAQVLGYYEADRTVFLSRHNQSEVIEAAQQYLRTSRMAEMQDKFRIIPAGIETEQLDAIYRPDRYALESGFNVLSVGRIFGPSYAIFLEWADYLYKSGMDDFKFTVSLSGALSGPMRAKLKRIGFDLSNNVGRQFNLIEGNPRSNFLQMLQKYSCFVCPLSHLDHPTGLFECIYLGLPGIMPRSDYQESFFPDWPWVIDSSDKAGLVAKLLEIRDDPKAAREQIRGWRPRIKEMYDATTNIRLLSDDIEAVARKHINNFRTSQGVMDLCAELHGGVYSFSDVIAHLKGAGRMGVSVGDMTMRTTFTYGRSSINHAMKCVGYVDDCTTPVERFIKRERFDNISKAGR